MKEDLWKISIIVTMTIVSISTLSSSPRNLLHFHPINPCSLQYTGEVADKPNIFVIVNDIPGVCYINNSSTSSVKNFHPQSISCNNEHPDPRRGQLSTLRLTPDSLSKMETFRGVNYNALKGSIYYAVNLIGNREAVKIVKRNINSSMIEHVFDNTFFVPIGIDARRKYEVTDLTYDWITGNIYMNTRTSILMISEATLKWPITIIDNRTEIISLVVHPNKGYLYFIDVQSNFSEHKNSMKSAIYRSNQDGSNITQITPTDYEQISSLAIDFHTDRLYWSERFLNVIKHSKLDGSDVKSFPSGPIFFGLYNEAFASITVDKNYVYYINGYTKSVLRHKKVNNEQDKTFELKRTYGTPIAELMVYDPDAQKVRDDHPCLYNNGGCKRFCFALPHNEGKLERSCKCGDGEILDNDQVSCHII